MADLQSKMNAHQQDIDQARKQIDDTAQRADAYLTELTKRVEKFEKKHANSKSAGQYLKSALDASRSATQKLKDRGQELSERSVPVALDGVHAVRESLDDLQKQAVAYDTKYAGSRGQEVVDTLQDYVNAGRQRATDAMETTNEQLMKLRDAIGNIAGQASLGAQVATGEAVRAAEIGNEKLGVSNAAVGVVQKVCDLDARLGVTAAATMVDKKLTGGLGSKMAATTVNIATESVSYISDTLQSAKSTAQHSETAQEAEGKGAAVADAAVTKSSSVKQTFTEAYEKSKERFDVKAEQKAGEVKDTTVEKSEQAKSMAKEKAGQVKDKAGEMTDLSKEKASQATDVVKDKAGEVSSKAGEVTESTKVKAGQAKEMAADKAGQVKDKAGDMSEIAKDKAGLAKNVTEAKAGQVKEKSGEMAGSVQEKAGQAKEMTKEKTGQAVDTAKDQAGMVENEANKCAGRANDVAEGKASEAANKFGKGKANTQEMVNETKESPSVVDQAKDKAKNLKDHVKDRISGAVSSVKHVGARAEAKASKPKEPSLTQDETTSEKTFEAMKQTRAKESEAAKTAAGTARTGKHGKHESTGEMRDTPGFRLAQQQASKDTK